MGWSRGRNGYLHTFHTRAVFYSTRKVPVSACVPLSHADMCLRMPYMSAGAPARACACVRMWYSFQILWKAWFPQGNDRGHLIGEGWKQHLHPIGHTHDIKVLARQKHVKEIYIAALTAPHTQGHRPLPLPIIKVTVHLLCMNSIFPITNKNITVRFFLSFFVTGIITHSIHSVCLKLPIRIREWASRREMIRLAQPLCMDLNNKREISLKALSAVPIRERGKWENGHVQWEITANWGYNEHV